MNLANRIQTSLARRRARKAAMNRAIENSFESLESRRLYSITAVSLGGLLTVLGDNNPNAITVSRDAAGKLLVNGGDVKVIGGTPTVANTSLIAVFGLGGNDTITLSEVNGALPKASLLGG